MVAVVLAVGVMTWGPPGQSNGEFAPGWNGMARTPPMGWRSWNAFGNRIDEQTFYTAIDAMVAKNWTVDGEKVSLLDIGYHSVGIDEGWEGCGLGVNGTQHYVNGTPAVNSKFPEMKALVDYGHTKSLKMGFYQNGCACGERVEKLINYEGDVHYLAQMGFDAVKLDGCGRQRNLTLYAELMKATGKNYSIENCHWGDCTNSDDSSCPTLEWCPFNWYRSSGDINAANLSWFNNLQTTIRFQSWDSPVSRPGCWAYPDMLEVGRLKASYEWNRAHFGAWCIVSAPLILGLELTSENLEPIMSIISNKKAIAVNQAWAGHPGSLVWSRAGPPPPGPPVYYVQGKPCDGSQAQKGFSYDAKDLSIKTSSGLCLDGTDKVNVEAAVCTGAATQQWKHTPGGEFVSLSGGCLDVWYFTGPRVDVFGCNNGTNQRFTVGSDGVIESVGKICLEITTTKPGGGASGNSLQLWAKPMGNGSTAVLLINADPDMSATPTVLLADLNMTGTAQVYDIWSGKDSTPVTTSFTVTVKPQDSVFWVLSS